MNKLKTYILVLPLLGALCAGAGAQSLSPDLVSTAGASWNGQSVFLSWSVGEMAVETHTSPVSILTQGFQQPEIPIGAGKKAHAGNSRQFDLHKNYPNPFNPTTTISFTVQRESQVTLRVYDMFGQQLQTLADGRYTPGKYSVEFDAGSLPSGMYVYTLEADGVRIERKMQVMK